MDKYTIKGNWKKISGKLKKQYAQLTDDDLLYEKGQDEELLGKLQAKLGKAREEIVREIEKL